MVDQMAPMMAMVQQELNTAVQIITQEIAQVEAMFVQEVDHLLGIPTTQSPMPASGAGSNSGSGSGATMTHTAPNQQLNSSTTKSGSGSGSSAPTTHAPVPTQGSTNVRPLDSDSGSGTGSGSASQSSSATVSGKVWLDNNGDNSLDSTEMGYYGATVNLINVSTGGYQSTTTDANGNYNFTFTPGGTYEWQIQVVFPYACFAALPSSQSQIDANGYSQDFTLGPGGSQTIWGGIQSLNVTTTSPDDPNGPIQQNQIMLRDAMETGNNGAGLDPNRNPLTITFINPSNGQPLSGTINLQAALPNIAATYSHQPNRPPRTRPRMTTPALG